MTNGLLKKYLAMEEKTFNFRIKTLFPLDDAAMELMEKALQKYRPDSISAPKKTMFQTNPLGFVGVSHKEIFMVDVELTVPVTSTLLEYDLRNVLGMGKLDENIKVFGENDPVEQQEREDALEEEEAEKEKEVLLNNDNFEEVEELKFNDYFGDEYNTKFLDYVKKVEEDRKVKAKAGNVDAKNPISTWDNQSKAEPSDADTEQDNS